MPVTSRWRTTNSVLPRRVRAPCGRAAVAVSRPGGVGGNGTSDRYAGAPLRIHRGRLGELSLVSVTRTAPGWVLSGQPSVSLLVNFWEKMFST